MIGVVVLQSGMDLRKGERGSSSDTCVMSTPDGNHVTGMEAERVSSVTDEEDQESVTVPEIRREHKVCLSKIYYMYLCIVLLCCMLFMKQTYF